jgi:hypothetical protein
MKKNKKKLFNGFKTLRLPENNPPMDTVIFLDGVPVKVGKITKSIYPTIKSNG